MSKSFLVIACLLGFAGVTAELSAQNQCLVFDGTSGTGAEVPDDPTLDLQIPFSIEAWIYPDNTDLARILSKAQGSGPGDTVAYTFRWHHPIGGAGDEAEAVVGYGDQNPTYVGTTPLPGEWHHWAVVVSQSEVQFFLDGVMVDSQSHSRQVRTTTTSLMFGHFPPYGQEMSGRLDEVRIWSKALTQQEIAQNLYVQVENVPGLVSSWHFDGDMQDSTGSNHGFLQGNAYFAPSDSPIRDADEDDDGLLDSDEVSIWGTDPDMFDSDLDGLGDGQELGVTIAMVPSETDLVVFREDSDPLTTTDPLNHDTDGGGASDGNEDVNRDGAFGLDEGDPQDPLDDLFQLSVLGLSPGQQATISVWECRPGSVVVPLFSMAGQTTRLFPDYFQLELNLTSPINQLSGMTVGGGGTAFSTIWVPPYVQVGRTVFWQAVEITGGGEAYRPSIPISTVVL